MIWLSVIKSLKPLYKYCLLIIASLFLLYGVLLYDSARYSHGYNAAKLEAMERYTLEQSELKTRFETRIEYLTQQLIASREYSEENRNLAIELQKLIDTTPIKEVTREIEIIRNDCSNIPDYGRVLHNILGSAPTIPSRSTK